MLDVVIRRGLVIDGTGTPGFEGDIGIAGDRVVAVGQVADRGALEIDAAGLAVAPGFIDPHTHYDCQITWDRVLSSSAWHGITSVVMGNCGFGIAPCRAADRETLMRMLVRVEGMSYEVMAAGIQWGFESFADYLRQLERSEPAVNVGAYLGHSPVRQYVMGGDAWEREATPAEIEAMQRVVTEAMQAGALGFSTSLHKSHVSESGGPVPSRAAASDELLALARAVGRSGTGVLQVAIATAADAKAVDALVAMTRAAGRPMTFGAVRQDPANPAKHRDALARVATLRDEGLAMYPQVTAQPLTNEFTLAAAYPFYRLAVWRRVMACKSDPERLAVFADAEFRAAFWSQLQADGTSYLLGDNSIQVHSVPAGADASIAGRTIVELARARGASPHDTLFDLVLEHGIELELGAALFNVDAAAVAEILRSPLGLLGLSDAGAHATLFCDAGQTSRLLGHWVRDQRVLPIEEAVRRITSEPAQLFALAHRGRLAPGWFADVVVFDPAKIDALPLEKLHDMPAGGARFVEKARGVAWSLVNGRPLIRHGELAGGDAGTGAGKVLRSLRVA